MSHQMKKMLTRAAKAVKKGLCAEDLPKEPAFEKTFQKIQKLLDEARVKFHTASYGHLCAAKKHMESVEKRYSKAWVIHNKKSKSKRK